MEKIIETLRKTDYFADLPEAVLETLAESIKIRHFRAGEAIFSAGGLGNAMFVIASGEVKITVVSSTQQEITLALLTIGDAFGELSLLDGGPRSASAIAGTDVELLALYREEFLSVIESDVAVLHGLLGVLAQIIRHTNQQVVDAAMLDVAGRVSKVLLMMMRRYGKDTAEGVMITRQLSYQEIASMSGMYTGEAEDVMAKYQYSGFIERLDDGLWLIRDRGAIERAVDGTAL